MTPGQGAGRTTGIKCITATGEAAGNARGLGPSRRTATCNREVSPRLTVKLWTKNRPVTWLRALPLTSPTTPGGTNTVNPKSTMVHSPGHSTWAGGRIWAATVNSTKHWWLGSKVGRHTPQATR